MEKHKILIVDDDPQISRLVKAMIEEGGTYVTEVENRSCRALWTARSFKPDLVLLDVDMPGKDGGDIAQEMKMDPALKDTPVIFLTALVSPQEAQKRQFSKTQERFLSKPAEPAVLLAAIEETLGMVAEMA